MLGAAATSESYVRNPLRSQDCLATLECLRQMGLQYKEEDDGFRLFPAPAWQSPEGPLDCCNSGTTIRLLSGLIAARPISATLTGDASLCARPMGRIREPLSLMGAEFQGETAPVFVRGGGLKGIEYQCGVPSAQVKSAVLFAGLGAEGKTTFWEPSASRDHTERMLGSLGVSIAREELPDGSVRSSLPGGQSFAGFESIVVGDLSSAAFFMVAAALLPEAEVFFEGVGLNPTRSGILDIFLQSGVRIDISNATMVLGEPVADLIVWGNELLRPFVISGRMVPTLIDEIPILAVLATQCVGTSVIRDAAELKVKESDRIDAIATGLLAMGANIEPTADGMLIHGPSHLRGANVDSKGDHRIAMAFAIAGLIADGTTQIENAECIGTSYPEFESDLKRLLVV